MSLELCISLELFIPFHKNEVSIKNLLVFTEMQILLTQNLNNINVDVDWETA